MMNIEQEIEKGKSIIAGMKDVIDHALIGSAMYMPDAKDVDFAILIKEDACGYCCDLHDEGWGKCGEYDSRDGIWSAIRRDNLNFMITHDKKFFDNYKTAMEVCKALNLKHKNDRIAVCQIVRDGLTADEVAMWRKFP